jgi:hypothetical protein
VPHGRIPAGLPQHFDSAADWLSTGPRIAFRRGLGERPVSLLPAPYNKKGINGASVETVMVDEAGGTTKQVTEYRNLVERAKVDAVIGYISSGDCLAIAPLPDELKKITIFFDCGTPRIFEDASYKYLFRTGAHATMDNVAAARYLLAKHPKTTVVAASTRTTPGARIPGTTSSCRWRL